MKCEDLPLNTEHVWAGVQIQPSLSTDCGGPSALGRNKLIRLLDQCQGDSVIEYPNHH